MQTAPTIMICREGYEAILRDEMIAKGAFAEPAGNPPACAPGAGLLVVGALAGAAGAERVLAPFIFEQQRLEAALWFEDQPLKAMARAIVVRLLPAISSQTQPWTLHAFASNPNGARPLTQRAEHIRQALLDFCDDRFTVVYRRYRAPEAFAVADAFLVLQLCVTPGGLWGAVMPSNRLSDARPGGVHRMRFDAKAPARSYLKIEEVFERMGEAPAPGQRVVDLGAAPGGWSYAFLKRGCRVLAVDNGPLKLQDLGAFGKNLTHLRENGISFTPPPAWRPLDWMVSDMLVPPGQTLGMFRRWMEHGWMRRFVFNVKLPQQQPYPVLKPIEAYLHSQSGIEFHIRQLYHDRREVTVFGRRD
ncbi:MAG: SAM-dependent methyltransferase [Kiritimatiellia bacterium]|jgi:23S rRNA C2498 (ribose-2'-O)-methylase RlmM